MKSRCMECDTDFEDPTGWKPLCPRCAHMERALEGGHGPGFYPLTRTEQLRERLGVSGNVDE